MFSLFDFREKSDKKNFAGSSIYLSYNCLFGFSYQFYRLHVSFAFILFLTFYVQVYYDSVMDIDNILGELESFSRIANIENIEEIMRKVDALVTSIPEEIFYSASEKINLIMKLLNPIYIEKMKLNGKLVPFSLESLLSYSLN